VSAEAIPFQSLAQILQHFVRNINVHRIDTCRLTPYTRQVIKSFRNRHLKALYEGDRAAKIAPVHVAKLRRILTALDRSGGPDGMDLPGYRLHPLKGRLKAHYAVSVSGNWRVTFRFEDQHAVDVNYLDYH
jgi:proteic killer suppression protein